MYISNCFIDMSSQTIKDQHISSQGLEMQLHK